MRSSPIVTRFSQATALAFSFALILGGSAFADSTPTEVTEVTEVAEAGETPPPSFDSPVTRLSGDNRYDTAVRISERYVAPTSSVYVATGENFPDALAASAAAAAKHVPVLLTPRNELPANVANAIRRLAPETIYIVGGGSSVSGEVESSLRSIAPIKRLSGNNRYETGIAIVKEAFPNADSAFIVTGHTFPDALSATGAAGALGTPVILVDGSAARLDASSSELLRSLNITKAHVVGGEASVSAGIFSDLQNTGYSTVRRDGADRYATAANINNAYFSSGSNIIFLAKGTDFPDALAGAALAGLVGAPLYVTTPECTPGPIFSSINAMVAQQKVILGGTSSVSHSAESNTLCVTPVMVPGTIKAGAFCKDIDAGKTGRTSTGKILTCKTSSTDSRLRWR